MVNPVAKGLVDIINNTPLSIRSDVKLYNKLPDGATEIVYSDGFTMLINKTPIKYGICLNANCYNMEDTLVHECLHLAYPNAGEMDVDDMTKYYMKYDDVKYAVQRRINERVKYMRG